MTHFRPYAVLISFMLGVACLPSGVWAQAADEEEDPEEQPEDQAEAVDRLAIEPVNVSLGGGYRQAVDDSLLRWQQWSDWAEWYSRQSGTISFRQGGPARNAGLLVFGHENRHQRYYHEGILMNDRVSGSMNMTRMPHLSFASYGRNRTALQYRSEYVLQRPYVVRPLTRIHYEQSRFEYRSTRGYLTRNIGERANVEFSYWGKNLDDEGYPRSDVNRRQIAGSAYYHLDQHWKLRASAQYTGIQLHEPGGYSIEDMNRFHFDHRATTARQSGAESSVRNTLAEISLYHRSEAGEEVDNRLTVYRNAYRRFFFGEQDSTFYDVAGYGVLARGRLEAGPVSLGSTLTGELNRVDESTNRSLEIGQWAKVSNRTTATFAPFDRVEASVWGEAAYRDDGFFSHETGARAEVELLPGVVVHGAYAQGNVEPTIQALYWNSVLYRGEADLEPEQLQRMEYGMRYRPLPYLELHARAYTKQLERSIVLGTDDRFIQSGSYASDGADAGISLDSRLLEMDLSATAHRYRSDTPIAEMHLLNTSGTRAWVRGSLFYKNEVLDQAAFVKAGVSGVWSTLPYRGEQYLPQLDYWDPTAELQALPGHHRLDVELSGRVRSAFVYMKLENALDGVTQAGYFETPLYPMPSRRFRFGVRWFLRN